jgi:hypothetical protein
MTKRSKTITEAELTAILVAAVEEALKEFFQ